MFEKRNDLVRFLAVAEAQRIGLAAERLTMTQPALTRVAPGVVESAGYASARDTGAGRRRSCGGSVGFIERMPDRCVGRRARLRGAQG